MILFIIFCKHQILVLEEWAFDCFEIRNRLKEQFGTLGDYVKLKGGPQALKNAAYHIRVENIEDGIINGRSQWADNVRVEVNACRPLFCNEQFYPFRPDSTNTYVIFPYDIIEGEKGKYLSMNTAKDFLWQPSLFK